LVFFDRHFTFTCFGFLGVSWEGVGVAMGEQVVGGGEWAVGVLERGVISTVSVSTSSLQFWMVWLRAEVEERVRGGVEGVLVSRGLRGGVEEQKVRMEVWVRGGCWLLFVLAAVFRAAVSV